ncbi:hypothetical protein THASP1DRAFT_32929 [Thamnocephalis sphaerospora]|uniref:Prenylcysteine lyase domain-containing protein n=1 Tax=Thamnocephalis sphaerospora TaxID=78915 RepID=A0A4P9XIP2_9FUNG|nr:hypothetical protein THASP1DRAFT_32929 [Thamnocephalis sphaerospora]|eukprot:RKP05231.1 hypothetical protein THASP1DRAFT_32929 [Thamnocephalis sphaerospora]
MRSVVRVLSTLVVISAAVASVSLSVHAQDTNEAPTTKSILGSSKLRVAIIGAGIAGSSAAYYLQHPELLNLPNNTGSDLQFTIDVYEKDAQVGGRATSRNFTGSNPANAVTVDIGGSLFVSANANMMALSGSVGVERNENPMSDPRIKPVDIVWNGRTVSCMVEAGSIWDPATWAARPDIASRYGGIETLTNKFYPAVGMFLQQFAPIYQQQGQWSSVSDLVSRLGMQPLLQTSFYDYLTKQFGVPAIFVDEVVSALTNNNYGVDARTIHAAAGLVSSIPIIDKMLSIKGGNQKLVEALLSKSGAKVRVNSPVVNAVSFQSGICNSDVFEKALEFAASINVNLAEAARRFLSCRPLWVVQPANGLPQLYDAVIFAAPFYNTPLLPITTRRLKVNNVDFKNLHVTVVTGNQRPSYYGQDNTVAPSTVWAADSANSRPEFRSMGAVGYVDDDAQGKTLIKYFSDAELSSAQIANMFTSASNVFRHKWAAYPIMSPANYAANGAGQLNVAAGAWYVNAMEPFISTMETETISAKNIASLMRQWFANLS